MTMHPNRRAVLAAGVALPLAASGLGGCATIGRSASGGATTSWAEADAIVAAIARTSIRERDFLQGNLPAAADADARPAILAAIEAAHAAGGGLAG
jgi:hypothetical protein